MCASMYSLNLENLGLVFILEWIGMLNNYTSLVKIESDKIPGRKHSVVDLVA